MIDIHSTFKFSAVIAGAFITTALCFYLMLLLISHEMNADIELDTKPYVQPFIAEAREETPAAAREKPQKALPLAPPPDPDATQLNLSSRVEITAERPTFGSLADELGPIDVHLELDAPNSDLTPLHMVQPIYPMSAAMRQIEGYVIVSFSVRENGTVSNPVVMESAPSVMFDEAALNAVSRFKFKPREVGGDRMRVDNVQMKFVFSLESLYENEAYR